MEKPIIYIDRDMNRYVHIGVQAQTDKNVEKNFGKRERQFQRSATSYSVIFCKSQP